MQTFLPFESFTACAVVLDNKRLGKQRVEVLQILSCLVLNKQGWKNHPAVRMWAGHEGVLCEYGIAICEEWIYKRFCLDECLPRIAFLRNQVPASTFRDPWWLGCSELHISHQSNLLRKDSNYYRGRFPLSVPDNLPYWWPTEHEQVQPK